MADYRAVAISCQIRPRSSGDHSRPNIAAAGPTDPRMRRSSNPGLEHARAEIPDYVRPDSPWSRSPPRPRSPRKHAAAPSNALSRRPVQRPRRGQRSVRASASVTGRRGPAPAARRPRLPSTHRPPRGRSCWSARPGRGRVLRPRSVRTRAAPPPLDDRGAFPPAGCSRTGGPASSGSPTRRSSPSPRSIPR
jgi:hypothetical protein